MRVSESRLRFLPAVLVCLAVPLAAADPARDARWRQDLSYLSSTLVGRHPNLFFQVSQEEFDGAVADLDQNIPQLTDEEVTVGLMRIAAMAGDGHTALYDRFPNLSVSLRWFSDGLFVTTALPEHSRALGARVVAIGDTDVQTAYALVTTIIGHENDAWVRERSPDLLVKAGILSGLHIAPAGQSVRYVLEDASGAQFSIDVALSPMPRAQAPDPAQGFLPLWLRDRSTYYWAEYLPSESALYIAYNSCTDRPDLPFSNFISQLESAYPQALNRIIFDLRNNSGGNSEVINPFYDLLRRHGVGPSTVTLIGQRTFSSGIFAAVALKDTYGATLIGGPTGGRPNHYGYPTTFNLPNSGMVGQVSRTHFTLRSWDNRLSVMPDVSVGTSSVDYFARNDPAVMAALAYPVVAQFPHPPGAGPAGVNAASFGAPVSPGALASVGGDFSDVQASEAAALPLPTELGGVRVTVNGVAARLLAIGPARIYFQVPGLAAPGSAALGVTVSGREAAAGTLEIAGSSPGIFVLDPTSPNQPGTILNQDSQLNDAGRRARRNERIRIFATGLGALSVPVEDGAPAPASPLAETVGALRVFIGTEEATVLGSALVPGLAGLWQIDVRVPDSAVVTGLVPVVVFMNGNASNAAGAWFE